MNKDGKVEISDDTMMGKRKGVEIETREEADCAI